MMLDMKILNRRPKIMKLHPSYLLKFYAFKRVKRKGERRKLYLKNTFCQLVESSLLKPNSMPLMWLPTTFMHFPYRSHLCGMLFFLLYSYLFSIELPSSLPCACSVFDKTTSFTNSSPYSQIQFIIWKAKWQAQSMNAKSQASFRNSKLFTSLATLTNQKFTFIAGHKSHYSSLFYPNFFFKTNCIMNRLYYSKLTKQQKS